MKQVRAKQLPREEWDFYDLNDQEALLAFYYEFGRSSDEVRRVVAKMRTERPPENPNVWPYFPREHHLIKVLEWLARLDSFPEIPTLKLKENAIAQIRQRRANTRRIQAEINSVSHPGIRLIPGNKISLSTKLPNDAVDTLEWMCEAKLNRVDLRPELGYPRFVNFGDQKTVRAWREAQASTRLFPIEQECFTPRPEFSVLEWKINWYMPDSELIWWFSEFLKRERPHQFQELAIKPKIQLSFTGAFPFRRNAALQWLGVLRRRQAVNTWGEYFDLYVDNGESKLKKDHRHQRGRERARQEDCRRAKLILGWFDNGTRLKKGEFK